MRIWPASFVLIKGFFYKMYNNNNNTINLQYTAPERHV